MDRKDHIIAALTQQRRDALANVDRLMDQLALMYADLQEAKAELEELKESDGRLKAVQ